MAVTGAPNDMRHARAILPLAHSASGRATVVVKFTWPARLIEQRRER
jgi:hypothetical protein